MPALVRYHTVKPFTGGQYSNTVGDLTPHGHLSGIINGEFTIARATGEASVGPPLVGVSVKKRGGTARYNSVATSSQGLQWQALGDFWRYGASLTPTQVFVGQAGATLYTDTGLSGTWATINTSSGGPRWGSTGAEVNILPAQGFMVFSNSNSSELPQKYDQTTLNNLTSAYQFTAAAYHLRRLWGVGETASADGSTVNPSRATYSAGGDITTYTGADAGAFVFDEDDGDRLIGVSQPWNQQLFFFKGPQYGSIHVVGGLTPATFTKNKLISGFPCVSHRTIITTPNDIYWMSFYGIHSLALTLAQGESQRLFLSYPVQDVFNTANFTRMGQAVAFYHSQKNLLGWAFPTGSSVTNDTCLVYDLVARQWVGTWVWNGFTASCFGMHKTPTTRLPRLYIGGYDGFVRAANQTTFTDDGTTATFTFTVSSPTHLDLREKAGAQEAQIVGVDTFLRPTGSATYTLSLQVDGSALATSYTVNMGTGGGALLGSTFIVGTSMLASGSALSVVPTPVESRGRSFKVTYTQPSSIDSELYGYGLRYVPGDVMSQEVS